MKTPPKRYESKTRALQGMFAAHYATDTVTYDDLHGTVHLRLQSFWLRPYWDISMATAASKRPQESSVAAILRCEGCQNRSEGGEVMTLFLTVLAALWTRDFLRAGYRRFMNIRADNKASAEDHCQLANREWERMKSTGDT